MIRRTGSVLGLALALLLCCAPASQAAGTGGVEVSPYPGVKDGHAITAFHVTVAPDGTQQVRYSLRNTTDAVATATIYAASAEKSGTSWVVGSAGSTGLVKLPGRQVSLQPHELRQESFTVDASGVEQSATGAVVVEARRGSITERAATLVYVTVRGSRAVPVVLASLAGLLILGTAAGLVRRRFVVRAAAA